MATFPKEHESLYFDTLIRTQKAESLLALITATYYSKRANKSLDDVKKDIAQRLKHSFALFRNNVRGYDNGYGSYNGDSSQFESQYTFGLEMAIWKNSSLDLNPLAQQVALNNLTIKTYINIIMLNYVQPINGENVHLLYRILNYMDKNRLNELNKEEIAGALGVDSDQGGINALYNILIGTSFFKTNDKKALVYKGKIPITDLMSLCNIEYEGEDGYIRAKEELNTEASYNEYIISGKGNYFKKYENASEDESLNNKKEYVEPRYHTGLTPKYPLNRIVFGAPGTGKSHKLEEDREEILASGKGAYERVTFHPDYSYAQFVGTYKPVTDDKKNITYKYTPGPFMRLYVKALENGKTDDPQPHVLIIEEINRANVAAVFGDVFQLLDRNSENMSEYPVQATEDIRQYLADELGGTKEDYTELVIPDNMFIWATMNSADQGVFPVDTAFKRRWEFEYLGINNNEEKIQNYTVSIKNGNSDVIVEWNVLRKSINYALINECNVNEDKLLGPFFISTKSLGDKEEIDPEVFKELFQNKVIMYLFEDAARQKRATLFAGCSIKNSYSSILDDFNNKGIGIFCESIRNLKYKD